MAKDSIEGTIERYNETAADYAKNRYDLSKYPQVIKDLYKFVTYTNPNDLVLDVGCGPGRDMNYFLGNGRRAMGIDFSQEMINEAKKRVYAEVLHMDMRRMLFEDEMFDGIWSCASFLHIPKSESMQTLQEFRRVLKPKGLLYISVREGTGENVNDGKFYSNYQKDEFESLLEKSGFHVLDLYVSKDERGINWMSTFAEKV
ncbi:MAG TPA: class I SAM-dependent methyltransferase [archaeon]|nr:class I SAM-dependent methyltransferase [archaeon]